MRRVLEKKGDKAAADHSAGKAAEALPRSGARKPSPSGLTPLFMMTKEKRESG